MSDIPTAAVWHLADALLDLAGALIDLQPPATQDQLAEIQVRMIQLKEELQRG